MAAPPERLRHDRVELRRWRGLATMAAAALLDQAFRLPGVDRVEILHDVANPASGVVAARLGLTEVDRVPTAAGPAAPGETRVDVLWRITANEWRRRTRGAAGP